MIHESKPQSPSVQPRIAIWSVGLLMLILVAAAGAEMPLDPEAVWESNANGFFSTGGAWADINGDGWLDLVVANGNDMARQHLIIYHNNGDGTFPADPTWSSADIDYHGHLDIGDVNGDGLPDAAVGVYIGPEGFGQPGRAKVYLNNGAGAFSNSPDWISGEDFYCFSVAFGDVDGDGDLDLACACGDDYYNHPEPQRVFLNNAGTLEATPSWQSDDVAYALDVFWGDADEDGDMDVAFCGTSSPMRVYYNAQTSGGGLETTASWQSNDPPNYGNTTALGDWNGDGFPEIAVADNNQLGGPGRFKVYANNAGILGTTPAWNSATGGYGSHVSWVDLDLDGDQDLAAGRWWGSARLFENLGGTLTPNPVWSSNQAPVVENMFWGDVDNDGLRSNGLTIASGDGLRTFFMLGHAPVRAVDEVRVGGVPLPPSAYTAHPGNGWISLATPPANGTMVEIDFAYSLDLDLGVTTWGSGEGNLLYLNNSSMDTTELAMNTRGLFAYPNPMVGRTQIRYRGDALADAMVTIHDAEGRLVRTLHRGSVPEGLVNWEWDRRDDRGRTVASGVYMASLAAGSGSRTLRLIVLR